MNDAGNDLRFEAAEVVRWHIAVGADTALDEAPHDRFAEALAAVAPVVVREQPSSLQSLSSSPNLPPSRGPNPAGHVDDWVKVATALARDAETVDALRTALSTFEGCALRTTAKSLIVASGNLNAKIMVISDTPEADDDRTGEAFAGRAGVLFDKMLASIGLDRSRVCVATAIPWRPPGNRAPTLQELVVCSPFIKRQIALVQPDILLWLGALPAHMLAGKTETILRLRGQWVTYPTEKGPIRALVSLSPAHLLRYPAQKRFAWRDLKAFRSALTELPA